MFFGLCFVGLGVGNFGVKVGFFDAIAHIELEGLS